MISGLLALVTLSIMSSPTLMLADITGSPMRPLDETSHPYSAASGEYEVIPLRIKNDAQERRLVSCKTTWGEGEVISSSFLRETVPRDFLPGATPVADAYAPLGTVLLRGDTTLDLLLLLHVPEGTKPGCHRGVVHVRFEDGASAACDIALHIFDFSLPERHTLPLLFHLDLEKLAKSMGISFDRLDSWTPLYDGLASLGFSYRVWAELDTREFDGDISTVRDHLTYVAATTKAAAVVDIGGDPGRLTRQLPFPTPEDPQDGLQTFLHDILARLDSVGVTSIPVAQPAIFGARTTWNRIRQDYARFARADARVMRILAAPVHPYFERYTDIWALPESTSPTLLSLLESGQSLIRYDQGIVSRCIGSEGALDRTGSYQTLAFEATDGSEASAWSPSVSTTKQAPWLEVTFRELYRVESISVLSNSATPMEPPTVETAYRAGEFVTATVTWKPTPRTAESNRSVRIGSFKYPRECHAVRLHFPVPTTAGPLEIFEVLFNNDALLTVDSPIDPVIPWLNATAFDYPAWDLGLGRNGAAARALPWRCWALGFRGILGPALNHATPQHAALVGVGVNQLLPTRRLFALRDGIEDYAYLQLYWGRVARKEISAFPGFFPGGGVEALDTSPAGDRERRRIRDEIGRLLSGETPVRRNFGSRVK